MRTIQSAMPPTSLSYLSLLAERYAYGLLEPFECARCGQMHVDPCGSTEKNEPICLWCSDPFTPPEPAEQKPNLAPFNSGSPELVERVAVSRKISPGAVSLAVDMGCLLFGRQCCYPSWILTDTTQRCAEARRIDGKLFPAVQAKGVELGERKAHTLPRSKKNWPVGILPALEYQSKFNTIGLVEGGPDFLALLHFALLHDRRDIQPVAILGRRQAGNGFHRDSRELFRGRRIRIYPHVDADGGGLEQAIAWGGHLERLGCEVDLFRLDGLRKIDGSPIKDLNDCVEIAPDQAPELEGLVP